VNDRALARTEAGDARRQQHPVLAHGEGVLVCGWRLGGIERQRRERRRESVSRGRVLLGRPGRLCELSGRRLPPEHARELAPESAELRVELVELARRTDGRAVVAEVSFDLALDGRSSVRGEIDAARRVKAVDGLDQPDRPRLLEVVELDAVACVLACDGADEREVLLDQALARDLRRCSGVNRRLLLPVGRSSA
jgi:hypothetical protein